MRRDPNRITPTLAALATAGSLLAGVGTAPAAPLGPGRVEPALLHQLGAGPAVAIMSFDPAATSRDRLRRSLAARGLKAAVFERVPVAYACAASPADALAMARAPGARAVVANEPLTPTLNLSVPTAFDGDPKAVWDGMGLTGRDVTIAVLDTGIDGRHPDLGWGTRLETNVRVVFSHAELTGPEDPICEPDRFTDEFVGQMQNTDLTSGHGTYLTGIAAGDGTASDGRYTGVAPEARLIGVGVADTLTPRVDVGPGCAQRGHMSKAEAYQCEAQITTLGAVAGIDFVLSRHLEVAHPTKVILAGWTVDGLYDPWHPLAETAAVVGLYGISLVTAVGNEGPEVSDCAEVETCRFNPLAVGDTTIAVAAGQHTDRKSLEAYSSRGDPNEHDYHFTTFRYEPTITAPGSGVISARGTVATSPLFQPPVYNRVGARGGKTVTDPEYVGMTGTSVAAAHVAGAVALMQQAALEAKGCYLTAAQVEEVLRFSASPLGRPAWEVGAGMLDITEAVQWAQVWPKVSSREKYICP